jgi:hypothetical protein
MFKGTGYKLLVKPVPCNLHLATSYFISIAK